MNDTTDRNTTDTQWGAIWILFLAACTVALHQGKMPPAVGLLRTQFDLGLTAIGWLLAMYAALIALLAFGLGLAVARVGYVRFVIAGVALAGIASLLGSVSSNAPWLAMTRAAEGAGWIIMGVAMPAVMGRFADDHDRPQALALFGAFVPLGAGVMLLSAPLLQEWGGWRLSWVVAGLASLIAAAATLLLCRRHAHRLASLHTGRWLHPGQELRRPLVWVVGFCFFFYAVQYLTVVNFLPTVLEELAGFSLPLASRVTAVLILGSVIGNVAAGRALQLGMRLPTVFAAAALVSSIGAAVFYLEAVSPMLRVAGALLFTVVSGAMPGALFASVGRVASVPAATGIVVGMMFQASGLGQLIGPVVVAAAVDMTGTWNAASVFSLIAGAGALLAARGLRQL